MKNIVVVGGGFAGMWAALAAARKLDQASVGSDEVKVTVINRDGFHCIRPRLYESDLTDARVPLGPLLTAAGVSLVEGSVTDLRADQHALDIDGENGTLQMPYDRLVYAAGSILSLPEVPGLAEHTFNIDDYEAADRLNAHVESLTELSDHDGQFTAVVVGAGFTGLELVCELPARLAALAGQGNGKSPWVVLVDQEPVLGATLGDNPRSEISKVVEGLGIETRLGVRVSKVDQHGLTLEDGSEIPAATVVWTGGALSSPLGQSLGVALDDLGRAPVDGHLRVTGVTDIFAAGDAARVPVDDDHIAVMSCQHAMPQGKFAGHNAAADLLGDACLDYRQPTYVTCLGLGPDNAIYTEGWDRIVRNTDAHQLKRDILTQWIYPPQSGDRAETLAAAEPVTIDYY